MRDSPNGNSYRSDSPDSGSPRERDRSYPNKSTFIQKMRDKERETRDYKNRDKYSGKSSSILSYITLELHLTPYFRTHVPSSILDCARSPKDKRRRESRDSEHRTNHDRNSTEVNTIDFFFCRKPGILFQWCSFAFPHIVELPDHNGCHCHLFCFYLSSWLSTVLIL